MRDLYIGEHPRESGYLVYDADSYWTACGETEEEAVKNWLAGNRTELFDETQKECLSESLDLTKFL